MDVWAWAAIGAGIVLLLVGIGYLADWGLRKRIKSEIGKRMRERADVLREQVSTLGWGDGVDSEECEGCDEDE